MLVNTTKTSKTYGSHGPYKRLHQKQSALTKLKGVPLLLKYLGRHVPYGFTAFSGLCSPQYRSPPPPKLHMSTEPYY